MEQMPYLCTPVVNGLIILVLCAGMLSSCALYAGLDASYHTISAVRPQERRQINGRWILHRPKRSGNVGGATSRCRPVSALRDEDGPEWHRGMMSCTGGRSVAPKPPGTSCRGRSRHNSRHPTRHPTAAPCTACHAHCAPYKRAAARRRPTSTHPT